MTIQWDAWDPEATDAGDGPVIGYQVYYKLNQSNASQIDAGFVPHMNETQIVFQNTIGSLEPSTEYLIQVSAVREGPGGIGEPSPNVNVSTVAMTTELPTTTQPEPSTQDPEQMYPTTSVIIAQGRQSQDSTLIVAVVMIVLVILVFIFAIICFIRRYVRRIYKLLIM